MSLVVQDVINEIIDVLRADGDLARTVNGWIPGEHPFIPLANYPAVEVYADTESGQPLTATERWRTVQLGVRVTTTARGKLAFDANKVASNMAPYTVGYTATQRVIRVLREDSTLSSLSGVGWLLERYDVGDTLYESGGREDRPEYYFVWLTRVTVVIKETRTT